MSFQGVKTLPMSGAALDVLRNGSRPSTSFNVLWNVCLPEQLYRTAVPMRTNSANPYIAPEPENISIEFHYPSVTRRIVGAMVALILTPICNLLLIGYVQREVLQVPRTVDSLILSVLKGSQNVIEAIVSVKAERSSSVYS